MAWRLTSAVISLAALGLPIAGCSQSQSPPDAKQTASVPAPAESPRHEAASFPQASTRTSAGDDGDAPANPPPAGDLPTPLTLTQEDWPQFRGIHRDGISRETNLLREWPDDGPELLWETAVGQGYAAPAVVAGRVYLNDYDVESSEWMVRCLDLERGDEYWRYRVKKRIRPNHHITRSVPATDGGFVFSIDPKCELHCLDARNGQPLWKVFLPETFGSQIPAWYNGQCPLLADDSVVIATGGRAVMVALEKATGEVLWETPNPDGFTLSHSSVIPAEITGVAQYVYMTLTGLVGVSADDGALLWHFPWKFHVAVPTSVVPIGEGQFFLTSAYQARTGMCAVRLEEGKWVTQRVYGLPANGWNSEVHTPILHRGYLFGVGKKRRGLWTCLDLEGKELWSSDRKAAFGLGGYVLADGMFFVLEGKSGTLRLLDAEADEYVELASVQLLKGPDVWSPPTLSRGKLLIRDLNRLICLQVGATEEPLATTATEPPP